jgi:hypothetical protein
MALRTQFGNGGKHFCDVFFLQQRDPLIAVLDTETLNNFPAAFCVSGVSRFHSSDL